MSDKVTINRLSTGVPGLDSVLGGGLPEYSFNLIVGPPGCGKTTLAHQMMFALATSERRALYCTVLGEPPLKMLRYQQQFDFFDVDAIGTRVHFINLADETLAGELDQVLARLMAQVQATSPAYVFVDSFRSITNVDPSGGKLPHFVQQLGMLMAGWQATSFLIGEYAAEEHANPVFTVADGLISLRQSVERNSMVRKMEVLKMRGQPTLPGLHTFRIGGAGVTVVAPAGSGQRRQPPVAPPRRLSLGLPELDAMLGGGLPAGYSLLVAGPSGSGKSILATAFLAEGARNGEVGIVAVFEQAENRLHSPLLAGLIANGSVTLVDSRTSDLSIDEIGAILLDQIDRTGATRVVIDSLSSFELVVAPTFRTDFRESLSRLVNMLVGAGVTVLMTSELEDRYTDLRFSPYGTAFLTDAIVVMRYVELDSRLQRLLAVVKVRASAHSDALRLYTIDAGGIRLGEPGPHHAGLLTGRPGRASDDDQG